VARSPLDFIEDRADPTELFWKPTPDHIARLGRTTRVGAVLPPPSAVRYQTPGCDFASQIQTLEGKHPSKCGESPRVFPYLSLVLLFDR